MSYKSDPRYNASGCRDDTAFQALKNIEKEEKTRAETERVNKLLATIFYICDLAGFLVEGRISLRDKKTGKIWR